MDNLSAKRIEPPDHQASGAALYSINTVIPPRQPQPERRAEILCQRPMTVWLTGLSGAGKSTIAAALEARLLTLGRLPYVLDGDHLRHGINGDLGFSEAARRENIRRTAEIAAMFNDAGLIVIVARISPYRSCRETARRIIGSDRFLEVHIATELAVCERRDIKGLYRRARAGEIPEFTGISSAYEEPESPDLAIDTGTVDLGQAAESLLRMLTQRGAVAAT
ncbi:MAG: adenylyl-sulfate kinase [Betaproteobacteria bacterium]